MGKTYISNMFCTLCGKQGISIPRKANELREPGHLKRLYCLNCQKIVNHVEIKPKGLKYTYEDFLLEFNNHNFTKDGNRIYPYKEIKKKEVIK